jgi:hypothetical protein
LLVNGESIGTLYPPWTSFSNASNAAYFGSNLATSLSNTSNAAFFASNLATSLSNTSNAAFFASNGAVWTKGTGTATILATNVGIRTATPGYALDVAGSINATGSLLVNGESIGTLYPPWTSFSNASNAAYFGSNGTVWTKGDAVATTYILASNVGIRTATPGYALEVNGDINIVNGSYRSNGILFTSGGGGGGSSQWTTSSANIYFTTDGTLASGAVAIGKTTPSYKLDVVGDIYASQNIIAYSDARDKTSIEEIAGALQKVQRIRGVTFSRASEGPSSRRYAGVIAQEVREVLPEVVCEDADGKLSVAYGNLTALLIEAVKELADIIESRKL